TKPKSSGTVETKKISGSVKKFSSPPHQYVHHSIPTSAFTPVNNLPLEIKEPIKEPIKITTSKKWFLPPRPKPGRKPVSTYETDISMTDSNPLSPISTPSNYDKDSISKVNNVTNGDSNNNNNTHSYRQISSEKNCFSFPPERNHSISNLLSATTVTENSSFSAVSSPINVLSSNCMSPKSTASSIPTPSPTPDTLSPKLESSVQATDSQ
ncbi:hypothetical protein C6P40_005060, partial [Pichia californica]